VEVDVREVDIVVIKTADKDYVGEGDYVTFTVTITNVGTRDTDVWVDITDVLVGLYLNGKLDDITVPAGSSIVLTGDQALGEASSTDNIYYYRELHYQVKCTELNPFVNTVTVFAYDDQYNEGDQWAALHSDSEDAFTDDIYKFTYASVWGYIFVDPDLDNEWDSGEVGVETLVVLWGTDDLGDVYRTAYSEVANEGDPGLYGDEFTLLRPGHYFVQADVLPGYTNTGPELYEFDLTGGTCEDPEKQQYDFGMIQYSRITGFKWLDEYMNGYQDGYEPRLGGWDIELWMETEPGVWEYVETKTTALDGTYAFENLAAGNYRVIEVLKDGWVAITPEMYEISLDWNDECTCCKFGNVELGSISGWKFYDWDMDEAFDGLEEPIEGWTLTLTGWLNDGAWPWSPTGATHIVPIPATTNGDGEWIFSGLLPGVYTVTEVLPEGWYNTTPLSLTFWITSGWDATEVKFGNVPTTTICGYKFFDKDMDGENDTGIEPGLQDWTIQLYVEVAPDVWEFVTETTTDGLGYYAFGGLLPGKYKVVEVMQDGWEATTDEEVIIDVVGHLWEPAEIRQDFGNMRYTSISGYKFRDSYIDDCGWPNGIWDEDNDLEYGLGMWTITIEGYTLTGVRVERSMETVSEGLMVGYYEFSELLPGIYWVNETLMGDWVPTTPYSTLVQIFPYALGPPVVITVNFGNLLPTLDPALPFVLHEGVNLWSTPLEVEGLTAKGLLSIIGPSAKEIHYLDESGMYRSYLAAWIPIAGLDVLSFDIVPGKGYFIFTDAYTTFQLYGMLSEHSAVDLVAGVNLIGMNDLRPMFASEILASVEGCTALELHYLDANGMYHSYLSAWSAIPGLEVLDFVVTPGRGYFLFVDGSGGQLVF